MLELLSYPPILKGICLTIVAGASLPVTGLFVLRLQFFTLRFLLMHGGLLGGILAQLLGLPSSFVIIIVNLLIAHGVFLLSRDNMQLGSSIITAFMVITLALTSILSTLQEVPGKEILSLLWGSVYIVHWGEVVAVIVFSLLLNGLAFLHLDKLNAVLFSPEIARSNGINDRLYIYIIIMGISFAVGFAIPITGILLLDALMLLPALIAMQWGKSMYGTMVSAIFIGLGISLVGTLLSLTLNLPPGGMIALVGGVGLVGVHLMKHSISSWMQKRRSS